MALSPIDHLNSALLELSPEQSNIIGAAQMDFDGAPSGGARYPTEARPFSRFHLDLGLGNLVLEPTRKLQLRDWLGFAQIPPPSVEALTIEQQFAGNLHAYTLPRGRRPNSRVRDLVHMLPLVESGALHPPPTRDATHQPFVRRRTHPEPQSLTELAPECSLSPGLTVACPRPFG